MPTREDCAYTLRAVQDHHPGGGEGRQEAALR